MRQTNPTGSKKSKRQAGGHNRLNWGKQRRMAAPPQLMILREMNGSGRTYAVRLMEVGTGVQVGGEAPKPQES